MTDVNRRRLFGLLTAAASLPLAKGFSPVPQRSNLWPADQVIHVDLFHPNFSFAKYGDVITFS